ncbi:MAG: DUF1016 domain-containing protein [bacterium]|nr:DUF1016 domain-containing protein [bacterium]
MRSCQPTSQGPYHPDFLSIGPDVTEQKLEMASLERLKNFLLELAYFFSLTLQILSSRS